MDQINQLLTEQLGPFGPVILVGVLGVFLILMTIPLLLRQKDDPLEKLSKSAKPKKAKDEGPALRSGGSKNKNLEKYSNFLEPQNAEELSAMRKKMLQAGYQTRDAVRIYHFAQFALGIGLLAAGVAYFYFFVKSDETTMQQTLMYVLIPGAAGYMAPKYWLNKRIDKRKDEIATGFPDALDLMLVCVEAGQSMDQSIIRVAKELRASYPALADEFQVVAHEMKAGKDKTQVLRDMSERAGVQDVASFVTVLIQSQQFGTSVAEALRVYAGEMRDKRVMRAEEKANQLPTKMTLVTMGLTVPPLLIILVGPSMISITAMGEMAK